MLRVEKMIGLWGLLFCITEMYATKGEHSDHEAEMVIEMGANYGTVQQLSHEKFSKKKGKSRYGNDVFVDLEMHDSHMINDEKNDERKEKKISQKFGSRRNIAVRGFINVDLLVAYNMTMMTMHPKQYNNMIMEIYQSALAKRKNVLGEMRGTEQEYNVFDVVDAVAQHFKEKESESKIMSGVFRTQEAMVPEKEIESGDKLTEAMIREVIQKIIVEESNKDELDTDEESAVKDTAILLGAFLTTQASQGKHANPKDLVGFLKSIDFIGVGQGCVHWWAPRCGCSPKVEKRFTIVVTAVGFLIMIGLSGLSVAIQAGAIDI